MTSVNMDGKNPKLRYGIYLPKNSMEDCWQIEDTFRQCVTVFLIMAYILLPRLKLI